MARHVRYDCSRSFKIMDIGTMSVPIFCRFRDKTIYWQKVCVFSRFYTILHIPVIFEALAKEPKGIKVGIKKTRLPSSATLYVKNSMFISCKSILACDRQTDKQKNSRCL